MMSFKKSSFSFDWNRHL